MKYDDPFDINPPFNPYISFTTPVSQIKTQTNQKEGRSETTDPASVGSTTIKDDAKHYESKRIGHSY